MKAVVYRRVSTTGQAEGGTTMGDRLWATPRTCSGGAMSQLSPDAL